MDTLVQKVTEFIEKTPDAELHLIKLTLDTCIKHKTTLAEMKDLSEVFGRELDRRNDKSTNPQG